MQPLPIIHLSGGLVGTVVDAQGKPKESCPSPPFPADESDRIDLEEQDHGARSSATSGQKTWATPPAGARDARLITMANAAGEYGLTLARAKEIIDAQVSTIRESWNEVADIARLSTLERQAMFGRQILPPYAFDGYPG